MFEFRKVANVGTSHPVVARLVIQSVELLQWADIEKEKIEQVKSICFELQTPLLNCYEAYDRLIKAREEALSYEGARGDRRVLNVPHIPALEPEVHNILYGLKNYTRDLTKIINTFFDTSFDEASDFRKRPKDGAPGKILAWSINTWGDGSPTTIFFSSVQELMEHVIPKRNAVEHPDGFSGCLNIQNYQMIDGELIQPVWYLNDDQPSCLYSDLEGLLGQMLIFGEEVVVACVELHRKETVMMLQVIPEEKRNPTCPKRVQYVIDPYFLKSKG
ncbi:MAG: hypothetical protein ACERJ1_16835 [Halodesulfovibrio sp.]|uniref:hypothetical protein n=1 Tax=Halodesulfovibrio sp. TaxID=1912772 RepID=UPI00359EB80F